ncbi:MAG: ROK family protein [Anaeromyxobacteraceae bacterium]
MKAKAGPALRAARTLCIDIGGTGLKTMVVSARGKPLSERQRIETPRPATPRAVLAALARIVPDRAAFDRVSVGFPGVVVDGVVRTAVNLHPAWEGFDLATAVLRSTGRPTRVLNDAGVQGYGVVAGRGVEICVTLGTGFGFSLFFDGQYVPNVEFGHHPFRKGKSYEDLLGDAALGRAGKKKWNRVLARAIEQLRHTFNFRVLYLGGGNARHVTLPVPRDVRVVDNVAGLIGGVRLWERG